MGGAPIFSVSDGVEQGAILITAILAAASVIFAGLRARRDRSPLPLYLLAGGAVAIFFEPFADVLGHAVFNEASQVPYIEGLGRHIPLYVGLIYFVYWPPAFIIITGKLQAGITRTGFAKLTGALISLCAVGELIPLHYGLWMYYGFQPLRLAGFPLWFAFVNAHGVIGTAVMVHFLLKVIPPKLHVLVVALIPPTLLAVWSAGGMWGMYALTSTTDEGMIWLGTCASMVLSLVLLWVYSRAVCREPRISGANTTEASAVTSTPAIVG